MAELITKLQAQMALFGTIDEVVCRSKNPETAKLVEGFLPGTTGVGQQGWYRELKHFLSKKELFPRDDAGNIVEREGPVTFPSLSEAVNNLSTPPRAGSEMADPGVRSRSLYGALVLTKAMQSEGAGVREMPGFEPLSGLDPLQAILPSVTGDLSRSMPGIEPTDGPPEEAVQNALLDLRDRYAYRDFTSGLARSNVLDAEAMDRPFCSGSLRKIGGKFCTILTTAWDTPFTISQVKEIIDPHNWPKMCGFFASMTDQPDRQPDLSRGWTRVLESVSGDKTQWEMRTALRYWKGISAGGEGFYINYDLDDDPRVGDCKFVEVDAGYIWATPITPGDPNSLVKLRTCKQVRIRGVSPTATAALGCGFGWGDAMSQMFKDGVEVPPGDRVAFGLPSTERPIIGDLDNTATNRPANAGHSDAGIAQAAEDVELIDGWRGAIIEAMRVQMGDGIDRAKRLGTDFAVRWSDGDGFGLDDVVKLGADSGREMTEYATGVFEAAAAALQPQAEDANGKGGND